MSWEIVQFTREQLYEMVWERQWDKWRSFALSFRGDVLTEVLKETLVRLFV